MIPRAVRFTADELKTIEWIIKQEGHESRTHLIRDQLTRHAKAYLIDDPPQYVVRVANQLTHGLDVRAFRGKRTLSDHPTD